MYIICIHRDTENTRRPFLNWTALTVTRGRQNPKVIALKPIAMAPTMATSQITQRRRGSFAVKGPWWWRVQNGVWFWLWLKHGLLLVDLWFIHSHSLSPTWRPILRVLDWKTALLVRDGFSGSIFVGGCFICMYIYIYINISGIMCRDTCWTNTSSLGQNKLVSQFLCWLVLAMS